jgi:hypothetical protein
MKISTLGAAVVPNVVVDVLVVALGQAVHPPPVTVA